MKKNGFVLLETVITICILSVVLLTMYASYAYVLRQSLSRNTYDLTDSIYEGYYITEIIKNNYDSLDNYFTTSCTNNNPGYICNISESDSTLHVLRDVYEVDKIYYINPKTYYTNADLLNKLDATTIDYVKSIGKVNNRNILIIKYKKVYEDGTYEVFHSKVEV
jgi:Tfp pilus assembly protein PilE